MKKEKIVEGIEVLKLLPLGSVVKLKESDKKVMVIGRALMIKKDGSDKPTLYEYMGCIDPYGLINEKLNLYFYDDDIVEIFDFGYCQDLEYISYLISQSITNNKKISIPRQ